MPNTEQPLSVSIVLVCHDDGKWLARCLESIRAQTYFDRLEVILADNLSSDGTDAVARGLIQGWSNALWFSTGGDNGFGVACNRAAEKARGKYLYLINPDTWLEPDCIEQLYLAAERDQAGVASGPVLDYDSSAVQTAGGMGFDSCGDGLCAKQHQEPARLLCPASFFFVRRDVFERVGMMDRRFFLYGEEMDLSWRVWISGSAVVPAPKARIHHRGAAGVNPGGGTQIVENRTSTQKRHLANRNRLVCMMKNYHHLLLLLMLPCLALILGEGLMTLAATRRWSLARACSLDAIAGAWGLRGHILEERRRIAGFRRRGDLWMLRFFRFGFARWGEIARAIKQGFPKFG